MKALPGWPVFSPGIAFGSPEVFFHNDHIFVGFVTQAGELSVFGESALPLKNFPLALDGVFYIQPVFDGEFLWLASSAGELFKISLEGEVLRHRIPNLRVQEEAFLGAFDCDGDKVPEIFVSGDGNALYGYDRSFNSLGGFPLPVWGRPSITDLNKDGRLEISAVGMDRKLYRWQFR
jgi:hypothetical protein